MMPSIREIVREGDRAGRILLRFSKPSERSGISRERCGGRLGASVGRIKILLSRFASLRFPGYSPGPTHIRFIISGFVFLISCHVFSQK